MSTTLFTALRDEFQRLVEPLVDAASDVASAKRLLAAVGADESFATNASLLDALAAAANLRAHVDAVVDAPEPSFAGAAAALEAADDLFTALRGIDASEADFARLGTDLVEVLTGEYLRSQHPLIYGIGGLLTLIEMKEDPSFPPKPGISRTGALVRFPFSCTRLRFDRLHDFINDPKGMLGAAYFPNGLATVADANAAADRLFPRVGDILTQLDVIWTYGLPREEQALLGDAAAFVDHAFQVYMPPSLTGSDVDAGLTFTFSSDDRGGLGLVLSPFGALEFSTQEGRVQFDCKVGAEVEALAIGAQGATFIAAAGAVSVSFKATFVPETADAPAFVLGSATGTRLELGTAQLGAAIDASLDDASVTASVAASSGALVIASGDGDSFLEAILPADGLRATFNLGVTYSTKGGLAFQGGAGLEATVPLGMSVAGVSLTSLYLGLRATDRHVEAEVSASFSASMGPVSAVLDRVGIAGTLSFPEEGGNLGVADLDIGFKSPSGIGLSIDAGPVSGGGFLSFAPERGEYAGEVHLQFELIALRALGLLTTQLPGGKSGYSLLVLVSADFPPLQLGFGFMLVGVGGLLGINRTVAVEALRAGLKTGALGAVLSPPDPQASAAQLVSTLAGLFPPAAGRHIFAPTARIVWGSPALITIELCLVLELPAPVRLVALGRLRAVLPDEREALVILQVDLLGVIDFGRKEAAVDATLVDSRLAQFTLTGDLALRINWGSQPAFLLAVGGFHPRFAAPAGFPVLARVAIALASGDNPKLRLEAYLALTSNTVQFGARVDLAARAGSFSIAGFLSFDALVTLKPLAFIVDIAAKLAVKAGRHALFSLSLALSLSGPTPWRAVGRASFSILFFDISFGFDVTIGDNVAPALPEPIDVAPLLLAAFTDARAWSAALPAGTAPVVTLRAVEAGEAVLAHPFATLQVRQRVAPLQRKLERFGTRVPSGATRFEIRTATIGTVPTTLTPLRDHFAPAQFSALSDDAKLSAPSFEEMVSGAALGANGYATGEGVTFSLVHEQLLVTASGVAEPASEHEAIPDEVFTTLIATAPEPPPTFSVPEAA